MKLSLDQIIERLPFACETLRPSAETVVAEKEVKKKEEKKLRQVRLFTPGEGSCRQDTLYLARSRDIAGTEDKLPPIHLCICGNRDRGIPVGGAFSVTWIDTDEADLLWIYELMQDIIVQYQAWDEEILGDILRGVQVQDILEHCAQIIQRQLAVFDLQQNLLMTAGFSSDKEQPQDSLWAYVLDTGHSPSEGDNAGEFNRLFSGSRRPFYYHSKDNFRDMHRLIAPLFRAEQVFGCLCMHDAKERPSQGVYDDFAMVQAYMNHAITHSAQYRMETQDTPRFIIRLLQGQSMDREALKYNLQRYGRRYDEAYVVWYFVGEEDKTDVREWLHSLAYAFKSSMVFYYDSALMVMDYEEEKHRMPHFRETLTNLLMQTQLKSGVSMVHRDATSVQQAFAQARTACSFAQKDKISSFAQIWPEYMLQMISSQPGSDALMYPGLNNILQEEAHYGIQLLTCLKTYIVSGRNAAQTAKALCIHRHTVLYRIERIQDILQTDLAALCETDLALLYISCQALLRN